jgi:hypothetical protein
LCAKCNLTKLRRDAQTGHAHHPRRLGDQSRRIRGA